MPTQGQVDQAVSLLSPIGKLIHLAWRYDQVKESEIATVLFKMMRQNYEDELTRQAAAVGCTRKGLLGEGQALSDLRRTANENAASITRTYNFDLARAIARIREENPRANRTYYTKRLYEWETARASWKDKQIGLMTVSTSRQAAQSAFGANNILEGRAIAVPRRAAEPECRQIVAMGEVSFEFADNNPFPLHINCIHSYERKYKKIPKSQCADLWLGQ